MSFYLVLFMICVFIALINELVVPKQRKYLELATLLLLIIVSGTRYNIGGSDYRIYKYVFDSLPDIRVLIENLSNFRDIYPTLGYEGGFIFLMSIIKSVGFNFYGFTLFHSAFIYSSLYIGLKKYTNNFNFLLVFFLYKLFFYNTFISLRQSITIGIFFLIIHFIQEKKPVPYFSFCLLAVQFHSAAIILFPIYFINRVNITKKKIIIANLIFIPTILLSEMNVLLLKPFKFLIQLFSQLEVQEKANALIFQVSQSSLSYFHTLEYFLIMAIVLFFYQYIIRNNPNGKFILMLFLVLLPLFTLLRNYEIFTRLKDYFTITYAMIIMYIVPQNLKIKRLISFMPAFLLAGYGYLRFLILFDGGGLIPYQSYLFEGLSIWR